MGAPPLRVMIYDNTDLKRSYDIIGDKEPDIELPSLSYAWRLGGAAYRIGRFIDVYKGVSSWDEALDWLYEIGKTKYIDTVSFWGHGTYGRAWVNGEAMDVTALNTSHKWYPKLKKVRSILLPTSTWWFRTCMTFGGAKGHAFAQAWTDFFGCNAVAHTCIIGSWGLHSFGFALRSGDEPHWKTTDGIIQKDGKSIPLNSGSPYLTRSPACAELFQRAGGHHD